MGMSKGYGGNKADGVKNKAAKATGNAPKQYPKVGGGTNLNWKTPNAGGGKGGAINKK